MPNSCKEQMEQLIMRMNPDLSKEQAGEVLALMNMRDQDLDFSDIPETNFNSPDAVRGLFYRGPDIRLNDDLRRYFADLSRRKQVPMNDLVNETLIKVLAMVEVAK